MKVHTTNYYSTFIAVAEDCPVEKGTVPPDKGAAKTVAGQQFEMIYHNPYKFDSDEVLFTIYADRNQLSRSNTEERARFFSKGQPCFRSSPLAKKYGWGVHSNADGKIALYGCETKEYQAFLKDKTLETVNAMRSAREK